jgi:hypothetical protein
MESKKSLKIQQLLENSFKLLSFRSYELMAINATLSANDVILVMPTGGGKSLLSITGAFGKRFLSIDSLFYSFIVYFLIYCQKF